MRRDESLWIFVMAVSAPLVLVVFEGCSRVLGTKFWVQKLCEVE